MPNSINLSQASVIVVDDNSAIRDLITKILNGFGVTQIVCCSSSDEGKAQCSASTFDLVLCDSDMPAMDGYEFLTWLRQQHTNKNCFAPMIMLSGHASMSSVMKSRDSGANITIAKPVTPKVLLQRIRWIIDDARPFVSCATYRGPDRRNKTAYPNPGRRKDDATELNPSLAGIELSQSGIDDLFA